MEREADVAGLFNLRYYSRQLGFPVSAISNPFVQRQTMKKLLMSVMVVLLAAGLAVGRDTGTGLV